MCLRVEALQSRRKGGVRLVPNGMRMEVRCVPKYSESLRGKSGGVSGEDRSSKGEVFPKGRREEVGLERTETVG